MGFFKKIFSGQKEYPELDAASPAARRLAQMREPLESLASQVKDKLEVVPSDQRTFVFIGKPPRQFGLAWIEGKKVQNLKTFVDEKKLDSDRLMAMVDKLREAYRHSDGVPRYGAQVGGKKVVVAPSEKLVQEVNEIIHQAEA